MHKFLTIAVAVSFLAMPVLAHAESDQKNGHHYQGGPKTEVSHSMKHPRANVNGGTVGQAKPTTNGHHYSGGPKTETIHHMGDKQ